MKVDRFVSALLTASVVIAVLAPTASAQRFVGTISVPGDVAGNMVLNPATGRLYMPHFDPLLGVSVANTLTNQVIGSLPVAYPAGLAFDPVRQYVYVKNFSGLRVFDATTDTYLKSLPGHGNAVATNPITGRVYSAGDNILVVADVDTGALIDVVFLPVYNAGNMAVNPFTNRIYVAANEGVVVVDGWTNEVTTFLEDPDHASGSSIDIDLDLNRIYIPENGSVKVIDGVNNQIVDRIRILGWGNGVAVNPRTHRVYVTVDNLARGRQGDILVIIDGIRGTLAGAHPIPLDTQQVVINPETELLYLAERYGSIYVYRDIALP